MPATPPLLAVTGLLREASFARRAGLAAVAGGGDAAALEARIAAVLDEGSVSGLVSFGIAGGLDPALRPGALVIGREVVAGGRAYPCDAALAARLAAASPDATRAVVAHAEVPVADASAKAALRAATGAGIVDMESGIAARLALARGLPLAVLRAVGDPAERALPSCALKGMRPDGGTDALAVLRALARRPGELPALLAVARDTGAAFRTLVRASAALRGA